jgi:two-component system, NtrC family, sensor histidine kinase HydH
MNRPTWRSNLAIFISLLCLVVGYFFWQERLALQQFREQAREHSRILAAVVERNINNVLASNKGLENVIIRFLKNSARFVSYLDEIERFSESELSAFAGESGLAGIKIIRRGGQESLTGPQGWLSDKEGCSSGTLSSLSDRHLYVFSMQTEGEKSPSMEPGCIIVGLATGELDNLREELSVDRLLRVLGGLHGIAYVRLEPVITTETDTSIPSVDLVRENNRLVSKAIFLMGEKKLVVALEAGDFSERVQQMRRQFGIFVIFLIISGTLSTWWLFRMQRLRVEQAREFERKLARQHEEAALGRAAETITHEMRNPLNAIGMGLQRLQIETSNLGRDHHQLIISMREAVDRSNSIISSLSRYTHSFELVLEPLVLADLIMRVMTLYQSLCDDRSIQVYLDLDKSLVVNGDRDLLGQLFENVIKNGIEAQPDGGFLKINLGRSGDHCEIVLVNAGCSLRVDEVEHVFEPYFTRKSKGTGLGLPISRKIAEAHSGRCSCRSDQENGHFYLSIILPLAVPDPAA